MQFKNGWMAIVALAFSTVIISPSASAQSTRTWDGGGGTNDWNTAANWSGDNVPDTTDEKALIPNNGGSGYTVDVNANVTCGAIEIYELSILNIATTASATLTLDSGPNQNGLLLLRATSDSVYATINVGDSDADHRGVLELKNNSGNGAGSNATHQIGGEIVLWEADSMLDIETDNAIFAPYSTYFGSVIGKDNAATVELDSGRTLTNQIVFEGSMQIFAETGTATFVNDRASTSTSSGVVWANASGFLVLGSNVILDDDTYGASEEYRPVWKASGEATLEFDRQAAFLVGDFVLNSCDATLAFMPIVWPNTNLTFVETTGPFTDGNGGAPYGNLLFRNGADFCWAFGCEDTDGYVGDCP